ncbi:endoplasmic reticulum protein [Paracoccidioides lutzii Pb01]|uniref:Glucosidase 2 subunit beta n=1 Tax=Paracoccidioides lutzii (strain ATCC MYA-826 / Pb01) TaxID=502779 RepID=C1GS95_PARBA|nr:endoplasmic reticulum protein [Paracoccidioides lutzii Pb01]EEH38928.1 endoplasmic reticulum protein [Paracoccidioides lutzii Pb01]
MKQTHSIFVLLGVAACSTISAAGGDVSSLPRGLGPEFAKYYKNPSTFTCISNPSIKVPFFAVNDDYCDCPDGSDEPGTSACASVSYFSPFDLRDGGVNRTPALPGFYCKNKGHRPSFVSFQRVNDGICDYEACCDGSDEWAKVGDVKCENKCKEIGKEWRKNNEQKQKSLTTAIKKRTELVAASRRLRKEVRDHISDLEVEIKASELKVEDLKAKLEAVRARDRGKVVTGQKQGKVNVLAKLAKERVEELREALVEVRRERDENLARVAELEAILSKFKEEYNPNFNDEGVKRAVRSWEDYDAARRNAASGSDKEHNRDLDEICKPDSKDSGINWEQWESVQDGEPEITLIYKIVAYFPDLLINYIEDKVFQLRSFLVSNGILADSYTDSTAKESEGVTAARNALSAEESSLSTARSQLDDHKSDLKRDYGRDSVFRSMKGSCISKDFGEYTYELCWMDQTKQKSKKGGSHTTMGNFARFTTITVDEQNFSGRVVPRERVGLEYTQGQTCWNGPERSTRVILECGENDEILKVTEDEKCMYSMFVTTPAVCEEASIEDDNDRNINKDEL